MQKTFRISRYWLPPFALAALIFWQSHHAAPPTPPFWFPMADKCIHAAIFGLLALLLFRAFHVERQFSPVKAAFWAFCLAGLYGGIDEFHQYFVTARTTEMADWLADVIGAAVATGAGFLLSRRGP